MDLDASVLNLTWEMQDKSTMANLLIAKLYDIKVISGNPKAEVKGENSSGEGG
jgi:hypothetical protein